MRLHDGVPSRLQAVSPPPLPPPAPSPLSTCPVSQGWPMGAGCAAGSPEQPLLVTEQPLVMSPGRIVFTWSLMETRPHLARHPLEACPVKGADWEPRKIGEAGGMSAQGSAPSIWDQGSNPSTAASWPRNFGRATPAVWASVSCICRMRTVCWPHAGVGLGEKKELSVTPAQLIPGQAELYCRHPFQGVRGEGIRGQEPRHCCKGSSCV